MGRLYWTVYQNALVWTGELKSLLSLPNYQPKIDRAAMEDFLGLRYMIGDRSWFENVELLPAATVFTWDIPGKTLSRNRYWGWDELTPLTTPPPESEAVETLGHLFVDAVQSRVYPGERVGLTLSGGLDSRAILAAMPIIVIPLILLPMVVKTVKIIALLPKLLQLQEITVILPK